MRELLSRTSGARLTRAEYSSDFAAREWVVDGHDSWKFERQQHFKEPADSSWNAFAKGDWDAALGMIETERDNLNALAREAANHNCRLLRVRVVEKPITPYLQWELHLLRLRAECGELIRVIDQKQIEPYEVEGQLPELLTLGPDTVYRIVYDTEGILDGAVRYVDSAVTRATIAFIERLYDEGEDVQDYFLREVARLPPPDGGTIVTP